MKEMSSADLRLAVRVLKQGGVIALPTETTYGLACDPRNAEAVKKIFQIKGRSDKKPLQLIAASLFQVTKLSEMTATEKRLAAKYWPGPLTLLVRLRKGKKLAPRVSPKSTIGIRVTSSPIASKIVTAFGHPIAATSANRSGESPELSGRGVVRAFAASKFTPDFVLDLGALPRRKPSTVARIKYDGTVEVLRRGSIRL